VPGAGSVAARVAPPGPAGGPTTGAQAGDGAIDLAAVLHDSRDPLYRTPGGAVTAGTAVTIRLQTRHDDLTGAHLLLSDSSAAAANRSVAMIVAAPSVPCRTAPPDGLVGASSSGFAGEPVASGGVTSDSGSCDLWEATVPTSVLATIRYRFELDDGAQTAFYADGPLLDGGIGLASGSDSKLDYVITAYDPAFAAIPWLRDAVVYEIVPDRFANGDPYNDASDAELRYGYPPVTNDQVHLFKWTQKPEIPGTGRDYFGGDLAGIRIHLQSLHDMGVTALYLDPIFTSASNHGYDTRDFYRVDPRFGSAIDWSRLVTEARGLGMRIILDGVFDSISSDSPYFDRYAHFSALGACESVDSPYRSWFTFTVQAKGPCAGPGGPQTMGYASKSNIDSLPLLQKGEAGVRDLIYGANNAVAQTWLRNGASGWRLDAMSDASFPEGFWQSFRTAAKTIAPDAPIVGDLTQKADALPFLRGDTADTFMNYRFRNAVVGYLGTIDAKGFPDDGQSNQSADTFASKLLSIYEDYPLPTSQMALNLLDSHDTERVLWSLAPGSTKETAAGLAAANARLHLAALIQAAMPGAPTIYYGDEVGVTGAGDPDNRRTYPENGGDADLRAWYRTILAARAANPVLRQGDVRLLATDASSRAVAFGRTMAGSIAIVATNPDPTAQVTLRIPTSQAGVGGAPLRDGVRFVDALARPPALVRVLTTDSGVLTVTLPALGAALLVTSPGQSADGPGPALGVTATVGADGSVAVSWAAVPDAASYGIWRSPVAGGGYVLVGNSTATSSTLAAPSPGQATHVVVRAIDASGNIGRPSQDVGIGAPAASALPGGANAGPQQTPTQPRSRGSDQTAWLAVVAGMGLILVAQIFAARRRRR
jgi:glycosidase